jgi:MoaA/NifB/PqqE/SkfB family radical SAM enzyme
MIDQLMGNNFILDWVKLQITRSCNFSCSFCSQAEWSSGETIDLDIFYKNVLDRANKLRLLIVTGGEPLTKYSVLYDLLSKCSSIGTEVGIFSNVSLLTESRARELKTLNLSWIRTTLNGPSADVHELSYPSNSFGKTLSGIKNSLNEGIPVKIRTTVNKTNVNDIENLIDFVRYLGIKEIDFRPYLPLGDCNPHNSFALSSTELVRIAAFLMLTQQKCQDIKIKLLPNWFDFLYTDFFPSFHCEECHCGRKYIYVDAVGNYRSCAGHKYIIGSMYDLTVDEIWHSSKFLDDVRTYKQDPYCSGCPKSQQCHRSNCHLINYEAHQRFDKINPLCPIYLHNSKDAEEGYKKVIDLFSDQLSNYSSVY